MDPASALGGRALVISSLHRPVQPQPDTFRRNIPDLQVIVRDDIAVTWGLNRTRGEAPGEDPTEMWSRGARIFPAIDGRWQMIYQHVFFPVGPDTREGRMDLTP